MLNRPATGMGSDAGADARLRVMLILWGSFLMTIVMFFVVALLARPERGAEADAGDIPPLLYALAALGLSLVIASFAVKGAFYRRATEQGQPAQLQTGFILALALCESAALFGLVGLFVTGNDYAYALIALGALGEALHFPRREQVMSAYYKQAL